MTRLDPRQRSRVRARRAVDVAYEELDGLEAHEGSLEDPHGYATAWALLAIAEHLVGPVPVGCTRDDACPVPPSLDDHWPGCPVVPF